MSIKGLPRLSSVSRRNRRLPQRVRVDVKASQGARRLGFERQLVDIERLDGEDIVVRFVAYRRTSPAKPRLAVIRTRLQSPGGQGAGTAYVRCKSAHRLRDIDDDPMPPSRTRRSVRIVERHREALRARGRITPCDCGRMVSARAAETIENVIER